MRSNQRSLGVRTQNLLGWNPKTSRGWNQSLWSWNQVHPGLNRSIPIRFCYPSLTGFQLIDQNLLRGCFVKSLFLTLTARTASFLADLGITSWYISSSHWEIYSSYFWRENLFAAKKKIVYFLNSDRFWFFTFWTCLFVVFACWQKLWRFP